METLHLDFKEIISVSFKFLYFFGIMYPKLDTFKMTFIYIVRVSFFIGFFFGGIVLAELSNLYLSIGNMQGMMKALFLTLTNLVSIGKFFVICKNQKKLLELVNKINRKEFQPKSKKQIQSLKRYIRMSKMISFSLYAGCTMTCCFWTIYPYTEENGPFLPIPAYIPINTDKSTKFGLVYAYEIIATIIGGYTDLSADCLIASLIMVICAQLHILNDSLTNISELGNSQVNFFQKKQAFINQNLLVCIEHHKAIMEFAKEVTKLFTISIFGQFVVSAFVFCATFFEMIMVPIASVRFFSMALYQYCMLLEIFPICYFGNEVILESNKLINSAYHSNWMNYSLQTRKILIIFMTRSEKSLILFAGGFFSLSLDTFIKILKSSWSYVAVLIQIQKKK